MKLLIVDSRRDEIKAVQQSLPLLASSSLADNFLFLFFFLHKGDTEISLLFFFSGELNPRPSGALVSFLSCGILCTESSRSDAAKHVL